MTHQQTTTSATSSMPDTVADRLAYVEALVDMNALVLEAMWPSTISTSTSSTTDIVPLRQFIHQVLKRSRTTYSTLQTAFFYLFRARPAILRHLTQNQHPHLAYIQCGRRMFLASLIVASKFVQDKTYRNAAWANMAGLSVQEINMAERVFLGDLLGYRLYVAQATFDQWHTLLHTHVQAKSSLGATTTTPTTTTTATTIQKHHLFPSSSSITTTTKLASSSSSSLLSPSNTPALSPSSTASSSACSSPNLPSPFPNTQHTKSNNKRSLAHLLNSPQEPLLSRKRPCLSSVF